MGKVWSIQYLRAFAALAVVLYHLGEKAGHPFKIGAAGVDLFFVISGFIMWMISESDRPVPFWAHRAWRIIPMYWIVTALLFAKHVHDHQSPGVGRLLLSLAFIPHLDDHGQLFPILVPGWTLNFEMFFYLVFGFCLFAPRRRQLPILTVALGGFVLLGAVTASPLQYPLLLEFLAGAWLCEAWRRGWLKQGVVLIVAGVILFALGRLAPYSEAMRPLLWGLPAFLVVAGCVALEPKLPKWKALRFLGDASYSIYLTHGMVIGLLWSRLGWAAGVIAIVAGAAVYVGLERPLHRRFSASARKAKQGPADTIAAT